jgi:hypothetical protein
MVRALNGYQRSVGLFVGDDERCRVQWSDQGAPNVLATGHSAQRVYEIAAEKFPAYRLARGDVCIDFDDADMFEVMHSAMRRLSHERAIKHHIRGDWETPGSPDGRTTYAGALGKSAIVRRLYEFVKCHGYGLPVRYEIEIKPSSKVKGHYACLDAVFLVQSDGYSVELLRRLGYTIDRLRITDEHPRELASNWFRHLVRQYGPKLSHMIEVELQGDASRLGPKIKDAFEVEKQQRIERSRAAAANSDWRALVERGQGLAT